ncbi:MAG: class I SAM-dependent methyltransferase [Phascolarctobacterium sp.]|nr:class I SAM-dependent methyltransferase [Phascolarctobacterium sp.]
MKERFAVTYARNAKSDDLCIEQAKAWAKALNVPYIQRTHKENLGEMLARHQLDVIIVAQNNGPSIYSPQGEFSYHQNMTYLRFLNIETGKGDHLIDALDLKPGMRVLDGTLGLAQDAAIASLIVGESGLVVGTEASKLLHFCVNYGLQNYETDSPRLTAAMRRIKTYNLTAKEFLQICKPNDFNVIYFDPMFKRPVKGAMAMDALRPLSYDKPLDAETINLALKIAPKIVIKERAEYILREYGCTEFIGGKYSRIKFGIIRREEE